MATDRRGPDDPAIPELVRQKALARGEVGREWLAGLGAAVDELQRHWDIEIGATLHGGSESYVAAARTRSGADAVLKVQMPGGEGFSREVRTLLAADGRGYVRVLAYDEDRRIMLQERLGPSLRELGVPVETALRRICRALQAAWEVDPPDGLTTGPQKARLLADFIGTTWEELGRPCSEAVIAQALDFAGSRAGPADRVLVHGDGHDSNALQDPAAAQTVRFVDPDGLLADPAYDLGILMREFNHELAGDAALQRCRARCALLSHLTGVDTEPIWQWGFVERVSTGLYATQVGAHQLGRPMLEIAERLLT